MPIIKRGYIRIKSHRAIGGHNPTGCDVFVTVVDDAGNEMAPMVQAVKFWVDSRTGEATVVLSCKDFEFDVEGVPGNELEASRLREESLEREVTELRARVNGLLDRLDAAAGLSKRE